MNILSQDKNCLSCIYTYITLVTQICE